MNYNEDLLIVGVDGGGTHCRARLSNHLGQTLSHGLAGSANVYTDAQGALASSLDAIQQALKAIGLDEKSFARLKVGLGLAGAQMPSAKAFLDQWSHPFAQLHYASDAHVACLGAHAGCDGSILIIGTGICGWSIAKDQHRSWSGWGFPYADEGSGAWLGLMLLQLTLQTLDGLLSSTDLSKTFAADFENKATAIMEYYRDKPPAEFAKLAPLVSRFANQGDPIAVSIIAKQQSYIQSLLQSMYEFNQQPIVLMGGLAEIVKENLASKYQQWLADSKGDALSGAVRLARGAN